MSDLLERFKVGCCLAKRAGTAVTLTYDQAEEILATWSAAEELAGLDPLTIGPDGPDHVVVGVRKIEWTAERLTNEEARAAAVRLGALSERT